MTGKYKIHDLPEWEQPDDGFSFYIEKFGRLWAWMVLAIAVVSFYEVFTRYALNMPTIWVHETAIMFAGLCFAYGGPYAMARHRHIRVFGIYNLYGFKTRCIVDIIIALLTLFFSVGNAISFYLFGLRAFFKPDGTFFLQGTGSAWNPPFPPFVKLLFFVVMILISIQVILNMVRAVNRLRQGPPESSEGGNQ